MKKKLFSIAFMATIALAAGLNVSQNESETSLSDIALSNVEALANDESGGEYGCIYGAIYGGLMPARLCESCSWQFFLAGYSSTGTCS